MEQICSVVGCRRAPAADWQTAKGAHRGYYLCAEHLGQADRLQQFLDNCEHLVCAVCWDRFPTHDQACPNCGQQR